MTLLSPEECRSHVNGDPSDDPKLVICARAAERAAVEFLNRMVFADESEMSSAQAQVPDDIEAAKAAYDAALAAAADVDDGLVAEWMRVQAWTDYEEAKATAYGCVRGKVISEDIKAAMLLTVGHLFRNREDVVTGPGAAAVKLPYDAEVMLFPHRIGLGV